ncbi:phytoene desaturase family protein [Cytobacillus purgationiresistens]|uniref:Phytoene dehydrogenase-like protein n=1 Tax=Cytobacillus purgationiresistens TaxID=863449 RepID=A0ABU0ANB0_9BACI|nr:FAD-dependent oxidoreductase [Cytobacillus purgationiresistens]MDQ0272769.1 phytoene dehydrogenase-like protein [Cytobacillus purgationiresistens]
MDKIDVVIVGGGLAGLVAANYLVSGGKKVVLLEKSNRQGGRAITNNKNGVLMNLGAHAIYLGGEAAATFKDFGLAIPGQHAVTSIQGIWKNDTVAIPTSLSTIMSSSLLTWKGRVDYAKLMLRLMKLRIESIRAINLSDWAEGEIKDPMVRHIFYALCRLTTYIHAPELQLARPVLKQIKRSLKSGVIYVDGGWDTLIQMLRKRAVDAGLKIVLDKKVIEIEPLIDHQIIKCSDGAAFYAADCLMAVPPTAAYKMLKGAERSSLRIWKEQAIPVTAACLDLGIKSLPQPDNQFAIGLDQAVFFTNQSRAAKLSQNGTSVVSVTKYHKVNQKEKFATGDDELKAVMNILHPGWEEVVEEKQYLSNITVTFDFPHVKRKQLPGPSIPEMNGIYIAGDWAGHDEMLADAAAASGKRAAIDILNSNQAEQRKEG